MNLAQSNRQKWGHSLQSERIRDIEPLNSVKPNFTDLSGSTIADKHKLEGWYCSGHVAGCNRNCGVM